MEKLANEENPYSKEGFDVVSGKQVCCVKLKVSEVESALKCMKNGKAASRSELVVEMLKAAERTGVQWLTDIFNDVLTRGEIPEDWNRSILIPLYKGKGSSVECGSYRAVKMLDQGLKVFESSRKENETAGRYR